MITSIAFLSLLLVVLGCFSFLSFFLYFWLLWVSVAVNRLPLVAESGGYRLVAVRGLLVVMAPLVAEHGL